MTSRRRLFVVLLAVPQLVAFGLQFARGFVPFRSEPVRVPLSWDMFSTAVPRCDLRWSPPVRFGGREFASLRELGTRLEWDVVFDDVAYYRKAGEFYCRAGGSRDFTLHCFLPNGTERKETFACR